VGRMTKEMRIIDEEGKDVGLGVVGELVVKSEKCFVGYWGNPEATSKKIKNGWLYSGDLFWRDEEGYLYMTGRKSDMIIRGGENVYPQEVESCLEEHGAVAEAAIVGVPDKVMGEEVKAFVQLHKGAIVFGHGTFAFGKTLGEAYFVTALIEQSCKMKYYFDLAKR